MALCSCKRNERREGQRTCQACHTIYIRERRRLLGPITDETVKARERCRSIANYNRRLGALIPEPCQHPGCTSTDVQMVHKDCTKPLEPTWLCKAHRVVFYRERRAAAKVSQPQAA